MVARLGELMTALEHDPAVRVIIFNGGLLAVVFAIAQCA
jgi:enoyl-CoA hydratase/carnithine racemase